MSVFLWLATMPKTVDDSKYDYCLRNQFCLFSNWFLGQIGLQFNFQCESVHPPQSACQWIQGVTLRSMIDFSLDTLDLASFIIHRKVQYLEK